MKRIVKVSVATINDKIKNMSSWRIAIYSKRNKYYIKENEINKLYELTKGCKNASK